ncbi:MAG: YARHG domain-containing protein, partial [Lewinella sp.]|nr:YARHG domain-containing protein [Lewinella sp.]
LSCQPVSSSSSDEPAGTPATSVPDSLPEPPPRQSSPMTMAPDIEVAVSPYANLLGSYVGFFEAEIYNEEDDISWANRITIFLDSIVAGQLYGHSVVAGNARPFLGNFEAQADGPHIATGKEPGDDRYDGTFTFRISDDGQSLEGHWRSYRPLPVSGREFKLEKRTFSYDPRNTPFPNIYMADLYGTYDRETGESEMITEEAAHFNASRERLKKADVENLYRADLEVIRNAIYARHGYSFKNRRMRYIFDTYVDWYMPVSTDIRAQLTELERTNIDLLKRYEQHAERYYDAFGR